MIKTGDRTYSVIAEWPDMETLANARPNMIATQCSTSPSAPDDTFSRSDFAFDAATDTYRCPGGKQLTTSGTVVNVGTTLLYRASKHDCQACALKPRCCPKEPARKVPRSIYEGARDLARGIATIAAYAVSRRQHKKVEMLFAHLKRILRLGRLRLRGPCGARDEFLLAATAQNLRKLAKLRPMAVPA